MAGIEKTNGMRQGHGENLLRDKLSIFNHYVSISPDELEAYAIYLTYRVQRDLYEMCQAMGEIQDMAWEKFIYFMRRNGHAQSTAVMVMQKTLQNFRDRGELRFGITEAELELELPQGANRADDQFYSAAKLFSDDTGQLLVASILARVEFVEYRRQLDQGKNYSWEHYIDELSQGKQMWHETVMAFRDALLRLNFKPFWQAEVFDKL